MISPAFIPSTRLLLLVAISILIGILPLGCGENTQGPDLTPPFELGDSTRVIPQQEAAIIEEFGPDGTIVLNASSDIADSVQVGDIIIGQNEDVAPDGFLRKVTAKAMQGGSLLLETEQGLLEDAFKSMEIAETHVLRPSQIRQSRMAPGARLIGDRDDDSFDIGLDQVLYDHDGDPGTTGDQIKLTGLLSFEVTLFAEIDINWFELQQMEMGLNTVKTVDIDLSVEQQWVFEEMIEYEIAEFKLALIPVGGVVYLVPTLSVEAHVNGDLTVTFETGISYTEEVKSGFGYAEGEFYTIHESSKEFHYTPPELNATFSFETGASLNASCLLYGVAGPYIAGRTGVHFQSVLSTDPCDLDLTFDLEAILYADVGLECEVLNLDWNTSYELYRHPIGSWLFPLGGMGTIHMDPEPDELNASWTLAGPCGLDESGSGDMALSDLAPGDYTVTWSPVPGWITPDVEMQTLAPGGSLTFSGTYHASAGPVLQHIGMTNPTSAGWDSLSTGQGVTVGPIDDSGVEAWFVDDNSSAVGSGLMYQGHLTPEDVQNAAQGWCLVFRLRIPNVADMPGGSPMVLFQNGGIRYQIHIGSDNVGNPVVRLSAPGGYITVDLPVGPGYHLYEMRFMPGVATTTLLVDGEVRNTEYAGYSFPTAEPSVMWGAGSSGDTGQGDFALVEFYTLCGGVSPAEPATPGLRLSSSPFTPRD